MLRRDALSTAKSVHIVLDKETWIKFKILLVHYELKPQTVLNEFIKLLVNSDNLAKKIVENMLFRRLEKALGNKKIKNKKRHGLPKKIIDDVDCLHDPLKIIAENDAEYLYDIIEQQKSKDENSE